MSSLFSALSAAMSGLRASQAGFDLVARNVSNAGTPGYSRKVLPREDVVVDGEGLGVRTTAVQRQIDLRLQTEVRIEGSAESRLGVIDDMLKRVDGLFGKPEDEASIASSVTRLNDSLKSLATTPDSPVTRQVALDAAEHLARHLNSMSDQIQKMRAEAESGIADGVRIINDSLTQIAELNNKIATRTLAGESTADLEDQRDQRMSAISEQMDVRFIRHADNTVGAITPNGAVLLGRTPGQLVFDEHSTITAQTLYSIDPSQRAVGTVALHTETSDVDLIKAQSITGGKIAGYIELRDRLLTQAQDQLDELAHSLAFATSEGTSKGAFAAGPPPSVELRLANIKTPGDSITFQYVDTFSGEKSSITLTAEAGSADTTNPNTFAIGRADPAAMLLEIQNKLGARLGTEFSVASSSARQSITITDIDPAYPPPAQTVNRLQIDSLTGYSQSGTDAAIQGTQLKLFADGSGAGQLDYTNFQPLPGAGGFPQKRGFAQRISVANAVAGDDTLLVRYPQDPPAATLAPLGDSARPLELLRRLSENVRTYAPGNGLGSAANPETGTVDTYARAIVSFQGGQATAMANSHQDQKLVADTLSDKLNKTGGVNIDAEMTELLMLQTTYSANAKVASALDKMIDVMMNLGRS